MRIEVLSLWYVVPFVHFQMAAIRKNHGLSYSTTSNFTTSNFGSVAPTCSRLSFLLPASLPSCRNRKGTGRPILSSEEQPTGVSFLMLKSIPFLSNKRASDL